MFKIQIVHKTGRKTDLDAKRWPEIIEEIYVFEVGEGHYVNIPIDSVEIMSMEKMADD